jgi:hypothetical protein
MKFSIVFRIILALVVLGIVAGAAFLAFNAGLSYQLAQDGSLPAAAPVSMPYGYSHHPFFMHFGFFPVLSCLLPILLVCVLVRIIRGPRWHEGHMRHRWGPWSEEGVPPMFAEWHRRVHEEKPAKEQ